MPLDQSRIEMIGVCPQTRRGSRPSLRLRTVFRRPEAQKAASTGVATKAANTFARDRASLAGAVAIGEMIGRADGRSLASEVR